MIADRAVLVVSLAAMLLTACTDDTKEIEAGLQAFKNQCQGTVFTEFYWNPYFKSITVQCDDMGAEK